MALLVTLRPDRKELLSESVFRPKMLSRGLTIHRYWIIWTQQASWIEDQNIKKAIHRKKSLNTANLKNSRKHMLALGIRELYHTLNYSELQEQAKFKE